MDHVKLCYLRAYEAHIWYIIRFLGPILDCVLFCCFVNLVTMATDTHIHNSAICGPVKFIFTT